MMCWLELRNPHCGGVTKFGIVAVSRFLKPAVENLCLGTMQKKNDHDGNKVERSWKRHTFKLCLEVNVC